MIRILDIICGILFAMCAGANLFKEDISIGISIICAALDTYVALRLFGVIGGIL
jgi:hypothetical protein